MNTRPIERLLVVGDGKGVPEILSRVPRDLVVAIVAAEIRPQYHEKLKYISMEIGVPLIVQPRHTSDEYKQFILDLGDLNPDSLICHSYSMLVPEDALQIVEGRAFNIHMSLLPRNRGPNPIQWALIHGDSKSGVSLHVMDAGLDSGPLIDKQEVEILPDDTWQTLFSRVSDETGILLDRAIPRLLSDEWNATPQDDSKALRNKRIPRESFEIDFDKMNDVEIYNLIRAQVAPLKGAYLATQRGNLRFPRFLSIDEVSKLRSQFANC